MSGLVEVAPLPPVPAHDLFTYSVPALLRDRVAPGMRVRVPLGRQIRTGVVASFSQSAPATDLRTVIEVLDVEPFLPTELLELCRWTARYYLVSLADVIGTIVPAKVPPISTEAFVRLARRLDPAEASTLLRRAPARAH